MNAPQGQLDRQHAAQAAHEAGSRKVNNHLRVLTPAPPVSRASLTSHEFPPNPDGRGRRRADHAAGEAAWAISAGARQCAQETDASMARDDWKYASPNLTSSTLPAAESKHFLP